MVKFILLDHIINDNNTVNFNIVNNKKLIDELIFYKNKIDRSEIKDKWDNSKKLSNLYELIYLPNKKNRINSIASYQPLSRSYFKLWELIHDFNLIQSNNKMNVLCLAEGPGGFIEAVINFRKKLNIKDNIYGISLTSKNKDIPGWKKSQHFLNKHDNITITYGKDNTGDLYNVDNIKYLRDLIKGKAEFITADGGFDFSVNFNKQEELSYKIIFCEIISALSVQKTGGSFICKVFDMNTILTIKMIYLLTQYYEQVYITKPLTSRPANSEKYIVCKYFKGITNYKLSVFYNYIKNWDNLPIENILTFIHVPLIFFKKLKVYSDILIKNQIEHINNTINLIELKNKEEHYSTIKKNQVISAIEWCKKYNITINEKSNYLKKNNSII